MFLYVFFFFLYKAYVVGTHLMGTHNIYLYKEVDKNYTGCILKPAAVAQLDAPFDWRPGL